MQLDTFQRQYKNRSLRAYDSIAAESKRRLEKPCLQESSQVPYLCAKDSKPHKIAEELLKPCALETAEIAWCADALKKFQQVPSTKYMIPPGVCDMSRRMLQSI